MLYPLTIFFFDFYHWQVLSDVQEFSTSNDDCDMDIMDFYPTFSACDEKEVVEALPIDICSPANKFLSVNKHVECAISG